jgi:hypothetical protein
VTTEVVTAEGAAALGFSHHASYRLSWLDHIVRGIARAPGPTWIAYVAISVVVLLMVNLEGWLAGSAVGSLDPAQSVYALFFVLPLVLYHFVSNVAGDAADRFRPATDLDDRSAADLRYRLTITPAWGALVAGSLAVMVNLIWVLADPAGFQLAGKSPEYVAVRLISESFLSAMVFVLLYQVLRQLRIISGLHRAATHVDLLRPAPMHAFSRLTSVGAIGIIAFGLLTGLPLPGIPETTWLTTLTFWTVPMLCLGAIVFVLPLRGMNRRLVDEKSALMNGIAERIEAASEALHALVDHESKNVDDVELSRAAQTRIDALTKALSGLLQERDFVKKQSTWPWDPSTLRAVLSAIALPIVLFLITRFLDRVL